MASERRHYYYGHGQRQQPKEEDHKRRRGYEQQAHFVRHYPAPGARGRGYQRRRSPSPGGSWRRLALAVVARCWQAAFAAVVAAGVVITLVTLHNLYPVVDPVTPLGLLDRVSLLLGVHERSTVVVLDLALYSSTAYAYTFQRRVADGSFHLAEESKVRLMPGLFLKPDQDALRRGIPNLDARLEELVAAAEDMAPSVAAAQDNGLTPVLAHISPQAVERAGKEELARVVGALTSRLANSSRLAFFQQSDVVADGGVSPPSSVVQIGTLTGREQRALQWFAVNLLTHRLVGPSATGPHGTAVLLDVGPQDLEVVLAVGTASPGAVMTGRLSAVDRLSAFGRSVKLVTLLFKGMGLMPARLAMLTGGGDRGAEEDAAAAASSSEFRSECMNPIAQAVWSYEGREYHILGKEQPDFEMVRERNGPFAGKKTARPVAGYNGCHAAADAFVRKAAFRNETSALAAMVRGREVFMEGMLLEKAMERGLTLPYRGGDVRLKSFVDSLRHACKVPNADQPFACVDLMYLATVLDVMFDLKQGSVLRSSDDVGGFTAGWAAAAAFHVYENGL